MRQRQSLRVFFLRFSVAVLSVIFRFELLYECIQFAEIDICKDWTDPRTLGSAAIGSVVFPIFQVTCPEKFPEQFDEALVGNTPSDNADEDMMVDVVKAALDVALYKPFHACERPLYFG